MGLQGFDIVRSYVCSLLSTEMEYTILGELMSACMRYCVNRMSTNANSTQL